jgi:signal peptidase II
MSKGAAVFGLLGAFSVVGLLVGADLNTKLWASTELKRAGPRSYLGGRVVLEFRENSGVAFGLFRESLDHRKTTFMLAYSGLVASALASVLTWRMLRGRRGALATGGLIALLGGTIGNFVDRMDTATVTDFVSLRPAPGLSWPAFNVADACVAAGLLLSVLALWRAAFVNPPAPDGARGFGTHPR